VNILLDSIDAPEEVKTVLEDMLVKRSEKGGMRSTFFAMCCEIFSIEDLSKIKDVAVAIELLMTSFYFHNRILSGCCQMHYISQKQTGFSMLSRK